MRTRAEAPVCQPRRGASGDTGLRHPDPRRPGQDGDSDHLSRQPPVRGVPSGPPEQPRRLRTSGRPPRPGCAAVREQVWACARAWSRPCLTGPSAGVCARLLLREHVFGDPEGQGKATCPWWPGQPRLAPRVSSDADLGSPGQCRGGLRAGATMECTGGKGTGACTPVCTRIVRLAQLGAGGRGGIRACCDFKAAPGGATAGGSLRRPRQRLGSPLPQEGR